MTLPVFDPKPFSKYKIDPDELTRIFQAQMTKLGKPNWYKQANGFASASKLAAQYKSRILIAFTCMELDPISKLLEREVFQTADFWLWVNMHDMIAVLMNFHCYPWNPVCNPDPADMTVYDHYKQVNLFPMVVITNCKGEECGRLYSYQPGSGVSDYINKLKTQANLNTPGGCQ
jgi:hypothetical protein